MTRAWRRPTALFTLPVVLAVIALATAPASAAAIGFAAPARLAGNCGGEPSIDLDGKGHVYVSSPKGILAGVASCEGALASQQGVASWYSDDGGSTWSNKVSVGTIHGGGDSDTTVDRPSGDVYVADLEAVAADVCVSKDHGRTFSTVFTGTESCTAPVNLTGQTGPEDDREWITVFGPTASYAHKDVYLTYHDFAVGIPLIWRSQDGGPFVPLAPPSFATADPTFNQAVVNGTVIAKPVIGSDGTMYVVVTTQGPGNGPLDALWLMKSTDHGSTWTDVNIINGQSTNAQLGLVFNNLAMDGAGNLYVLTLGNTSGSVPPAKAYLFTSTDKGATWSKPVNINPDGKAVALPALHGGPQAGQLAVGFYHSTNTTDPNDVAGLWQYQALTSTNATSATPAFTSAVLGVTSGTTAAQGANNTNPAGYVHQGQICTAGINCTVGQLLGGGQGNRNLADFSSVTVDQNGCTLYTYGDDGAIKADQSNFDFTLVNNDVARQTSGCFPLAAATTTGSTGTTGAGNGTTNNAGAAVSSEPNTSAAGGSGAAAGTALALVGAAVAVARRRRRMG